MTFFPAHDTPCHFSTTEEAARHRRSRVRTSERDPVNLCTMTLDYVSEEEYEEFVG